MMVYAWVMLTFFGCLGVFSLVMAMRRFSRPVEANPEKLAATKKTLMLSSWLLLAAFANAVRALAAKQYYLLFASALMVILVLPIIVQYLRLKAASKKVPGAETAR